MHIKDAGTATLPETMGTCIAMFTGGGSLIHGCARGVFFSAGGVGQCIQPLLTAHTGIDLRFVFDTSKGQGTATEVTPLIRHIVMLHVHQTANFATGCVFNGHRHTTAITKLQHVEWEKIVSQAEVATELLR
jgi:hypothetical protein